MEIIGGQVPTNYVIKYKRWILRVYSKKGEYNAHKQTLPEDPRPALNCRLKMAAARFVAVVVVQTLAVAGLLLIAGQNWDKNESKKLSTIMIIQQSSLLCKTYASDF